MHEAPGINTLVDGRAIQWLAARGANVLDVDGNRYVDLTAGFGAASVGHAHPRLRRAVERQSRLLIHGLGDVHAHPSRIELAARLAGWLPLDEPQIYFAASGSDAVEVALKTAQLHTGRAGVIAFTPSYHGLTLGSLTLTSRELFREPFREVLRPRVEHLPFGCAASELERSLVDGAVGAVVVEPIVGREGVILPPSGWLAESAAAARRHGALLVADEVLTGFGRVGARFAVDTEGVRPDIVVCGKGLAGGLPIGLAAASAEVMRSWRRPGEARHTATFVAHPLACAAALAVLDVLEDERLIERSAALGRTVAARTVSWPARYPPCVEVRGRGLLWGIELAAAAAARRLAERLLQRGYLSLAGGAFGRVLVLSPPLSIAEPLLEAAIDAIADELAHLEDGSQ